MSEDYQVLIDEVSALLGTPATLENRDFGLIAFGTHEDVDDRVMDRVRTRSILRRRSTAEVRAWFESFGIAGARQPVRIPPEPAAGVATGRICLPVRHRGVGYGYIWLLDDGALDLADPRLTDALTTAARIGALLAAEFRSGELRAGLLQALLRAAPADRAAAAAELAGQLGPSAAGPMAVVAVRPWTADDGGAAALSRLPAVAASCPMPLSASGDDPAPEPAFSALALLVRLRAASSLEPARSAAARLLGHAVEAVGGTGRQSSEQWDAAVGASTLLDAAAAPRAAATAGVSAAHRGLAGLPEAWHEALCAARAARAEDRLGPVGEWERIGPYRMLPAPAAGAAPDPAVAALLRPAHRELANTAEVFLDCAGQAGRTASALGIHRQTLYYRLARIEELTGLALAAGEDRLLLHMALKSARLSR